MECSTPTGPHTHAHSHAHGHEHAHGDRRLLWALVLTGGFAIVEVAGGLLSHSLTLLADAGHMFTDTASLTLAWVALRFASMPGDRLRTYGYQRLQVLAAFVNSLLLLAAVIWIVVEAVQRLRAPAAVAGDLMMAVAAAGLAINIAALALLNRRDGENLNVRAAYLHVLADLLGSVMAMIAAGVILLTGWTRIDPLLSFVVAALIVGSAISVLRKSAHILLEGSPDWLNIDELTREIRSAVGGVTDVHHVHVWCLTSQRPLLTLHAGIEADASAEVVMREIKKLLATRYALEHSTIQIEPAGCFDHTDQH